MEDVFGDGEEVGDVPAGLVVEEEEAGIGACSDLTHLNRVGGVDDGACEGGGSALKLKLLLTVTT